MNVITVVPPSPPLSLMGSSPNALTVRLTWMAPAIPNSVDGAYGLQYIIKFYPVSEPSSILTETTDELTKTIGNLLPNTTYRFVVQAINSYGNSSESEAHDITTVAESGE